MRLRNSITGVVVNVRDDKPGMGSVWEPVDAGSQTSEEHVCDVCGFEAKSAGGLGSHSRTHEEG